MHVTIPIVPRGTGRPRACIRGQHAGIHPATKDVHHGDAMVAFLAGHEAKPVSPIATLVVMTIAVYLPRPKTLSKPGWLKKHGVGAVPCGVKPDWDNLGKGVCDSLVRAGWLQDDNIVWTASVQKWYAEVNGAPRYVVALETWGG